jgi:hypothetical protein
MFSVINSTVSLTAGDTASLNIEIIDPSTKSKYTMQTGDKIYLSLKSDLKDTDYTLQVSGLPFNFTPAMTAYIKPGDYLYDIQLVKADGSVVTLMPPRIFKILPGVTGYISTF